MAFVGTIGALTTPWTLNAPGPNDPVFPAVTAEEYLLNFTLGAVTGGVGYGAGAVIQGTGRGLNNFVASRTGLAEQGLIGRVNPPTGLKPGTTTFGNAMHEKIADLLRKKYPDVEFEFRIKPGQTGVDVTVNRGAREVGWERAEIKPRSDSGQKTYNSQLDNWGLTADDVQPITYDQFGNIYNRF